MQPDQTRRRPYPAFRAWLVRLVGYWLVGLATVVGAQVALYRWLLPHGLPPLLVAGMVLAAGIAVAKVFDHVVMTLLRDRHEATGRELETVRQELGGLDGGGDDGTV